MAPGYDDNPWKYKFTWNPRSVILAGQGGTVRFLHNGSYKYIPYTKVFRRTERINIEGYGAFEGYANRDSLDYLDKYELDGLSTIYRGTLRRPGFCRAWDLFVQLGITDDSYIMEDSENLTFRQFINSFLPYNPTDSLELKLMQYLKIDQDSDLMEKLKFLGIFSNERIGLSRATPAQILEHILKLSWTMKPDDKDMIVMWHKFFYRDSSEKRYQKTSSLVVLGENSKHTAMAKTVGLPMGIAAKLILNGEIRLKGLHLPVVKDIYKPILNELKQNGIEFIEKTLPQTDNYENQPIF
jgi:saccharopine dehydrogenase (NAD+, L-glutamate forming)